MSKHLRAGASGLLIAIALSALGPAVDSSPAVAATSAPPAVRSVVLITLPATSWLDIRTGMPPALTRLFRTSALADLATRTIRTRTDPGPGYLAVGTGARSIASTDQAATNLEPDERLDGLRAGDVFQTRTGHRFTHGIAALAWPQLRSANESASYGAIAGALGQTLEDAGIGRFVIGNADQTSATGPVFHREAVMTLVDEHGRTPGRVTDLLQTDSLAPFGRRLNLDAVDRAFPPDFATRRQVVTVDASDLARADAYRPLTSAAQRDRMHAQALRRSDALVARVLRHVDLRRDAVIVVSPFHSSRARTLTVAAIHTPSSAPGLVESATTRRAGFLQIVDVAPTVLDLLHIARPDAMEGRPAEYHATGDTYAERIDQLVRFDRASQFRDATIGQATAILVTVIITLAVLLALWFRFGRGRARSGVATEILSIGSLAFIGYTCMTFVVGALPMFRWGAGAYFFIVTIGALAFAGLCLAAGRRHALDPPLIALGGVVVLHLADLFSGAHLELNTVFGYSPTVGIRLAGIGNPGSAQVSAAALLFAVLVTVRAPTIGRRVGLAVLGVTLIAVGAPIWGQDYGGALALGPTLVLWWLLLRGTAVRVRTLAIVAAVLVGTGLAVGLIDLARPADSRTHVGRFFEKVANDGAGGFFSVIGRKLSLMISTFSNTAWVLAVISVIVLIALTFRRTNAFAQLTRAVPTLPKGLTCFAVLVVLATALNDSGVQVTGMMAATLLPVLGYLACDVIDDDAEYLRPAPRVAETARRS